MTPRDENTTGRNKMSLKSRIQLILVGLIITFISGGVTAVALLKQMNVISFHPLPVSLPILHQLQLFHKPLFHQRRLFLILLHQLHHLLACFILQQNV